jgi:hypothetical protein
MRAIVRKKCGSPGRTQLGLLKPNRELEVTMFTSNPFDALALAGERGRQLRAEAAAERLRGTSGTRRTFAASLRRAADRLDPVPLAPRPASQS